MPSFKVFIRWRPLPDEESAVAAIDYTQQSHPPNHTASIALTPPASHPLARAWTSDAAFARIFDACDNNKTVFEAVVSPTLPRALNGQACNFFAYGHSGSGKSHTIIGYDFEQPDELGLCLSTARVLYDHLRGINAGREEDTFLLGLRMYELRKQVAFDLLHDRCQCHIREGADGKTHIRGETEMLANGKVRVRPIVTKACGSFDELRAEFLGGIRRRATGTSTIHDQSSRTHAVFEIEILTRELLAARDSVVERQSELVPVAKRATDVYLEEHMKALVATPDGQYVPNPDCPVNQQAIDEAEAQKALFESQVHAAEAHVSAIMKSSPHACLGGRLVFVDLAGSEYYHDRNPSAVSRRKPTAQEQQEGRQINTDLLALKEVIRARAQNQTRIPFRSSPLTMVLREHFLAMGDGADAVSAMILTASPSSAQFSATVDTLKYGNLIGVAGDKGKTARR